MTDNVIQFPVGRCRPPSAASAAVPFTEEQLLAYAAQQIRQLQAALAPRLVEDLAFFIQNPDRRHRVRRAFPEEIALRAWYFENPGIRADEGIYVAICAMTPEYRCSAGFVAGGWLNPEMGETDAACWWLRAMNASTDTADAITAFLAERPNNETAPMH